jgi:hypothetical protein
LKQENEAEHVEFITKGLTKPIVIMAAFIIVSTLLFLIFS